MAVLVFYVLFFSGSMWLVWEVTSSLTEPQRNIIVAFVKISFFIVFGFPGLHLLGLLVKKDDNKVVPSDNLK